VDELNRNQWTIWIGMGGRIRPEYSLSEVTI
jgi:hypothetical protein